MNSPSASDPLVGFVDYDLMIERLTGAYPSVSPARIELIARAEYDAVAGDRLFVVPVVVEDGVRERLDEMTVDVSTMPNLSDSATG